jgi:hypothetical protein
MNEGIEPAQGLRRPRHGSGRFTRVGWRPRG